MAIIDNNDHRTMGEIVIISLGFDVEFSIEDNNYQFHISVVT